MRWSLVALLAIASSACSLIVDLADLGGSDASGADAAQDVETDAGDAGDASDAGDAGDGGANPCSAGTGADANLLCNPSFESAATPAEGCGAPWLQTGVGTFTLWDAGHTGTQSCLICTSGPEPSIRQTGPWALPPTGAQVVAAGWFAVPPSGPAGGGTINATLADEMDGGRTLVSGGIKAFNLPPDGGWVLVESVPVPTTPTTYTVPSFAVFLNNGMDGGSCILVDDVSLVASGP